MAKQIVTDEEFTPYRERSACVVVWAGNAVRFWEWAGDVQHWVSGHGHGNFRFFVIWG